jgi:hypothetical protein
MSFLTHLAACLDQQAMLIATRRVRTVLRKNPFPGGAGSDGDGPPPQVEQYLTTVGACVLEEGGKTRHLQNALAPILADTIEDEDKLGESAFSPAPLCAHHG